MPTPEELLWPTELENHFAGKERTQIPAVDSVTCMWPSMNVNLQVITAFNYDACKHISRGWEMMGWGMGTISLASEKGSAQNKKKKKKKFV